jgi:Ankyrin repeats (3 copies)/Peroxidase
MINITNHRSTTSSIPPISKTCTTLVALSGAHTLGSCHRLRSGYDGPWTHNPLRFDNEYYINLLELEWSVRQWDGPLQYTDPSGRLMMLPTDLALIQDEQFLPYVQAYAADEDLFFRDFAEAFGALLAKGCPDHCVPPPPSNTTATTTTTPSPEKPPKDAASQFRDLAMHGSLERMKELYDTNAAATGTLDVNAVEKHSKRTALHKAAYFGHAHVVSYLCREIATTNIDAIDGDGDTALHDAARFGHVLVVQALLEKGAHRTLRNLDGKTPLDLATANGKRAVVELLSTTANDKMAVVDLVSTTTTVEL